MYNKFSGGNRWPAIRKLACIALTRQLNLANIFPHLNNYMSVLSCLIVPLPTLQFQVRNCASFVLQSHIHLKFWGLKPKHWYNVF